MLFSRFASFVALLSLAGSVLAVPIPPPSVEVGLPKNGEIEALSADDGGCEVVEADRVGPIAREVEVETNTENCGFPRKLAKRLDSDPSLAASVLEAQTQLDAVKPEIEQAMLGPLGSIQKSVGPSMAKVHRVVATLNEHMGSFVGADDSVLYRNPSGGAQFSEKELAKMLSTCLIRISEIEDLVKNVSGYAVTSAQKNIREDLLSMKKTLGVLPPLIVTATASYMGMALGMGTGAAHIIA